MYIVRWKHYIFNKDTQSIWIWFYIPNLDGLPNLDALIMRLFVAT